MQLLLATTHRLLFCFALFSPWSRHGNGKAGRYTATTIAEAFANETPFQSSFVSSSVANGSQRKLSSSSLRMQTDFPPAYPVRIAVMGGGNFGLAIASIVARQGHPTTLLVRNEEIARQINTEHTHPTYMKGIELPHKVRATTDPKECLPDATYIVHAVPCQYSRKFLDGVKDYIPPNTPVLSVSKGIETSSLGFMADILRECLGDTRPLAFLSGALFVGCGYLFCSMCPWMSERCCYFASIVSLISQIVRFVSNNHLGPSFAREIVEGVATAVVIASEDLDLAHDLAVLFSDKNFKCYTSQDVVGVEIGGAVKNVVALGAGMCEGLGLGTNAMSGLVTRGCNEMRRLGLTFGARPSTIAGLSGMYHCSLCGVLCLFVFSKLMLI